ncbi:MAG TPA: hypothetical protein DDX29_07015 [Clostridiales bacterium]|nr:hypothetical protein [Clostridiales bacterium]
MLYVFLWALLIPWAHSFITLQSLAGHIDVPWEAFYIGETVHIGYQIKNRSIFRIPFLVLNNLISRLRMFCGYGAFSWCEHEHTQFSEIVRRLESKICNPPLIFNLFYRI